MNPKDDSLSGKDVKDKPSSITTAQTNALSRTDVLRTDSCIPGREIIQVRVGFARGASAARHFHHGEEIAFVLKGSIEYRIDGKEAVTLNAGQSIFLPAGVIHSAKNIGEEDAEELASYIVEKGKPLVVFAD